MNLTYICATKSSTLIKYGGRRSCSGSRRRPRPQLCHLRYKSGDTQYRRTHMTSHGRIAHDRPHGGTGGGRLCGPGRRTRGPDAPLDPRRHELSRARFPVLLRDSWRSRSHQTSHQHLYLSPDIVLGFSEVGTDMIRTLVANREIVTLDLCTGGNSQQAT